MSPSLLRALRALAAEIRAEFRTRDKWLKQLIDMIRDGKGFGRSARLIERNIYGMEAQIEGKLIAQKIMLDARAQPIADQLSWAITALLLEIEVETKLMKSRRTSKEKAAKIREQIKGKRIALKILRSVRPKKRK